ncbi:hypothetical protein RJ639_002989 [Escallonia herrerae]|uniref:Transcription factor IIIB 90 kDa subunit n=1 Tax=Escallonia herrerae TaxID=1293975 RepID=A0AA89B0A8_9ASTE|nr:hypothetical protein RJ639_002989 [Escallonia herrerae]
MIEEGEDPSYVENDDLCSSTIHVYATLLVSWIYKFMSPLKIAVERNFSRGRRRELVEAACLYLACRGSGDPAFVVMGLAGYDIQPDDKVIIVVMFYQLAKEIVGYSLLIPLHSGFTLFPVPKFGIPVMVNAAVCSRENEQPFLLIDFAEFLRINVYVLGAVFLQLCKLLNLGEHPIVQKPVDPSLFIHRFAFIMGSFQWPVIASANPHIAVVRGYSVQPRGLVRHTGRKPSGLCGAALYISALSHGHKYSKSDVVRIVHICEATLTKRLIEFENTKSGSLTIEEFNEKAEELEKESSSVKQPDTEFNISGASKLLCKHKGSEIPPLAHGLCESCYKEFIDFSGGLEGGSEPPAFQRAEQERKEAESSERNAKDSSLVDMAAEKQDTSKHFNLEEDLDKAEMDRNEKLQATEPCSTEDATMNVAFNDDTLDGVDGTRTRECGESESFSDIDDVEVDGYIHNEEEKHYKKIIWEEMNREYVEEQAAKEAAAAAAKEAYEANFRNCPEDMEAAREFAAAAAAAAMKLKKERQQKRAADARNLAPAQTAVEATRQMLDKKRLSSKINYDVLDKLFDESVAPENPKKSRTDSSVLFDGKVRLESEDKPKYEKLGSDDEFEDAGDIAGGYAAEVYDENVEEGYEYDEDYGFDGNVVKLFEELCPRIGVIPRRSRLLSSLRITAALPTSMLLLLGKVDIVAGEGNADLNDDFGGVSINGTPRHGGVPGHLIRRSTVQPPRH